MPVSSIINSGGFYFAAFITAAMVLLLSFVKYKNARPQNRIFHLFLYIILISAAALIMRIFGGAYMNTSSAARNMYFTGHYIYFIVHSLLAPVFCIYLFIVAQAVDLSINPKLLFLILPSVFMEAAIIVNPFSIWYIIMIRMIPFTEIPEKQSFIYYPLYILLPPSSRSSITGAG